MKTIFSFFILLFCTPTLIWSNPIDDTPIMKFSEMVFDEQNKWTLELYFPFAWQASNVDSVLIRTPDFTSKLNIQIREYIDYYIITSDSLSNPLSVKYDGDKIYIETFSHSELGKRVRTDSTAWGKIPGSNVGTPIAGYSICKKSLDYYTDFIYFARKSSLGFPNSFEGLGEKLTGHIYDKDNKLVTKYAPLLGGLGCYFEIHEPVIINPDGTYSTIMYPMTFSPDSIKVNELSVRLNSLGGWKAEQQIQPIYLTYINSDTVLIRDIHLKSNDYVLTGVEKAEMPKNSELTLINYPNPFNSSTNFFVKLPDDIKDIQGDIRIYNSNGQLIRIIKAVSGSTSYWDGKDMNGSVMSSGIYYYQLNVNNDKLKSGSMILLK